MGEDAIRILYPMLVLAPEMPDLVGVWWDEDFAPENLSCPRGGVFPDRIEMFDIRDDYGSLPPFMDKSPSPE